MATPKRIVGVVVLVGAAQELREPRRAAEDERQHAGRQRIERAGVADAALAERAPRRGDDVVRRRPGGLVDDEHAVHADRAGDEARGHDAATATARVDRLVDGHDLARARRRSCRVDACSRPRSCGRRRRTAFATAPTSTSPFDRRLTRYSSPSICLEEDDRLDLLHGERQVDQAFGVVVGAAGRRAPSASIEVERSRCGRSRSSSHRAQHRAEQLQRARCCCCRRRCARRARGSTPASTRLRGRCRTSAARCSSSGTTRCR